MVGKRIRELRLSKRMSQQKLADAMNVSRSAVSMWEALASEPDLSMVSALADFFGVSSDYILGRDDQIGNEPSSPDAFRIPVLGRVAAGLPLYASEEIIDWEEIPIALAKKGEYFALKIHGASMEPRICDGDTVIVKKQETCDSGQIAIVLVNGDSATCKRVVIHQNGISLVSFNPLFPPQFYTTEEVQNLPVRIIGIVVELRGKL